MITGYQPRYLIKIKCHCIHEYITKAVKSEKNNSTFLRVHIVIL